MTTYDKIMSALHTLKNQLSQNFDLDYCDVEYALSETEDRIHKILSIDDEYIKINATPLHIVASDKPDYNYMIMAYDFKNYAWRNADIYAPSHTECIDIARVVYGEDINILKDKDLNITIDYGPDTDTDTSKPNLLIY